jgi:hypothetical protein
LVRHPLLPLRFLRYPREDFARASLKLRTVCARISQWLALLSRELRLRCCYGHKKKRQRQAANTAHIRLLTALIKIRDAYTAEALSQNEHET